VIDQPINSILRRRRIGRRLPRPRPGRRPWQPQRQQVRTEACRRGGFINISQNAKSVVFVGTFGAGKQQVEARDGKLAIISRRGAQIRQRGRACHFSGPVAARTGRSVLYITERCVFALRPDGLELMEVAPGVDIERDILAHMDFKP